MLTYQNIDAMFGTPLNHVPKPSTPYQFKTWHAVVGVAVLILVVKGAQKINEDYFKNKKPLLIPLKLKDDK